MTFSQIYENEVNAARDWCVYGLCHVFIRLWNEFEAAGFRVKRGMTIDRSFFKKLNEYKRGI